MSVLDKIKEKSKFQAVPVLIEEWDCTLFVKPLSAGAYARIFQLTKEKESKVNADFEMIRISVQDEEGKPVFPTAEEIADLPPGPVGKLLTAVADVNKFGQIQAVKTGSETTQSN